MRLPDMTYTEQETELRSAVRSVLDDLAGFNAVLARTETPQTYDTALWRTLAAEVGCAGLLIPESLGGAGASFREAAVVAEEVGRSVAPVPFLGSAVLATVALLSAAGDDAGGDRVTQLLTELAAGTTTAALAAPFAAMPGVRLSPTVRIGPAAGGDADGVYRLSGTVAGVADALPADVLIVAADGVPLGLHAVLADDPGLTRTPVVSLDMTRQLCDLSLDNVRGTRIAAGQRAEQAVADALQAGAAMAAACLADHDPDTPVAVALAKAACSDTAVLASQEMIQLHGGIGFTWEHPAHLFLKRAKSTSIALGSADRHRGTLARLADLPPPAPR